MTRNYNVLLGVIRDASVDEIEAAFRRRALELHLDRSGLRVRDSLLAQSAV